MIFGKVGFYHKIGFRKKLRKLAKITELELWKEIYPF
jgi:hypothetical protein